MVKALFLEEMLTSGPEFHLTFMQGDGIQTELHAKQGKGARITANGTTLDYDLEKLRADPARYLRAQRAEHQKYFELISEQLGGAYQEAAATLDTESDIERLFGLVPETAHRASIEVAKLSVALPLWARFRRLRTVVRTAVQKSESEVLGYSIMKGFVNGGNRLFEEYAMEPPANFDSGAREDLQECVRLTSEISGVYGRICEAKLRNATCNMRLFTRLFPNDAYTARGPSVGT
jgi:hypothetical protein